MRRKTEAQQLEQRFDQCGASCSHILARQPFTRSGDQAHCFTAQPSHIVTPGRSDRFVGQPMLEVVIREQRAVVEIWFSPFSQTVGRSQLVPLIIRIRFSNRETFEHPQRDSPWLVSIDGENAWMDDAIERTAVATALYQK